MASEDSGNKFNFRRVVTGHDAEGKPCVWIDAPGANRKFPSEGITSTQMWSTDCSPTSLQGKEDEGNRPLGTVPPDCGSRFTLMEFHPSKSVHQMHRTDTVDYVIVISGQIDMFLDEMNFVTLRAGDVLVQRGTDHAWANRSDTVCRLAVVLLDATPKRPGSITGMTSAR